MAQSPQVVLTLEVVQLVCRGQYPGELGEGLVNDELHIDHVDSIPELAQELINGHCRDQGTWEDDKRHIYQQDGVDQLVPVPTNSMQGSPTTG